MAGYYDRAAETAAALMPDGWLRTGDGGYRDEDGYLFLTDRIKDMIVSGGENVYPVEVEEVLSQHPGVAEVAVIGVPDERWGETVKALVVRAPGSTVDADELVAFARGKLAGYKLPRSVEFVADLPRSPAGKVLKRDLRARYGPPARRPRRLPDPARGGECARRKLTSSPTGVGHIGGEAVGAPGQRHEPRCRRCRRPAAGRCRAAGSGPARRA